MNRPLVPNQPPSPHHIFSGIAVIGEAPGSDEQHTLRPFTGVSGRKLDSLLAAHSLARSHCYIGNLSQYRPTALSDDFFLLAATQEERDVFNARLNLLKADLQRLKPNIVILLGGAALRAAIDPTQLFNPNCATKITNMRGTVFNCIHPLSPFYGLQCMATFHPAYCLRDYNKMPLLMFDFAKAVTQGRKTSVFVPKQRQIIHSPTYDDCMGLLSLVAHNKKPIAIDIEGVVGNMSCISIAISAHSAFIVPFSRKNNQPYFPDLTQEANLLRLLCAVLEDPDIPKTLQNSLYDLFVLAYTYGIRVQGLADDTMLKHWALYAELPKSLAMQVSLYTMQPYYKSARTSTDDVEFYTYCCEDSLNTYEINDVLSGYLKDPASSHYRMNMQVLRPLLYMELGGILYDSANANARRATLEQKLYEIQADFNGLLGITTPSITDITTIVYENFLFKKAPLGLSTVDWPSYAKKANVETVTRIAELVRLHPSKSNMGELDTLLETGVNIQSPKQMANLLYQRLALPAQYDDDEESPSLTTNYEALIKLKKIVASDHHYDDEIQSLLSMAIDARALSTRSSMLSIHADPDGRIRCGYNVVGSNTGRITCYTSPTGSGYNLQTIPNYTDTALAPGGILGDRDLFMADPGYWFFQCDLKGADGWTVAAYSAMLGDRTMLDDYLFGLKPANIIANMLRGTKVDYRDRHALKEASKLIDGDAWDYFACKRVQHGASYCEGPLTISRNILKDSEGKCVMTTTECAHLSKLFFDRYPGVKKYHTYISNLLNKQTGLPKLIAASGQVRLFHGRKAELLPEAVAFEPQANTTYATNLAMLKLWNDPDNRTQQKCSSVDNKMSSVLLRIQPLHQVHDALCGQFLKTGTTWAIDKIKRYFNNEIMIAGQKIVIPFDGKYGESWGKCKEGKI